MPALPAIAIGVTVAATVASVAAAAAQANAQKKAQQYNASAQANNATILKGQADNDANALLQEGSVIAGKVRAAAAASGMTDSGSVQDVTYSNAVANTRDALAAKYRGTVDAYNATNQSALYSAAAKNTTTQAGYSAAGSLLSGGTQIYKYTNNGPKVDPIFSQVSTTTENPPSF